MNIPGSGQVPPARLSADEIRAAVDRVSESSTLSDSPRLQEFLRYVVNQSLDGHADRLKGVAIAVDVFHRDDADDAQSSTIVRVEAGRLRRRLNEYYASTGRRDPVHIDIPKGAYIPVFSRRDFARQESTEQPVGKPERGWRRNWTKPLLVATILASLVVLVYRWQSANDEPLQVSSVLPTVSMAEVTLAVLPFTDATSDNSAELVALGLTEDIITDASRIPRLDVISLSSVRGFENTQVAPGQLKSKLGVSHILRGSVRGSAASRKRFTAQLYEVDSGKEVWAERFDRTSEDLLQTQSELSGLIVDGISKTLNYPPPTRTSSHAPVGIEARALFRQAMDMVNPPSDPGRMLAARFAFKRVTEMAPHFAGGYAGVAYTHVFAAFFTPEHSNDSDLDIALELSDRALSLDPTFGLAYFNKAFIALNQRDYDQAVAASKRAVAVQPSDPYLNAYHAFILATVGDSKAAIQYAEHAVRLDPLNPRTPYLNILGVVSYHAGDYAASLAAFQRSVDRGGPASAGLRVYHAAALVALDRPSEALEVLPEPIRRSTLLPHVERIADTFQGRSAIDDLAEKLSRLEQYRQSNS